MSDLDQVKKLAFEHQQRPMRIPADLWQRVYDELVSQQWAYRSVHTEEDSFMIGITPVLKEAA